MQFYTFAYQPTPNSDEPLRFGSSLQACREEAKALRFTDAVFYRVLMQLPNGPTLIEALNSDRIKSVLLSACIIEMTEIEKVEGNSRHRPITYRNR